MKNKLSIVVPVYMGSSFLRELCDRTSRAAAMRFSDWEIILINDASPDNSWDIIRMLCAEDRHIKGVNLSKNFGQHYAITAGLSMADGEWITVMDCDLQDVPEEIIKLYDKALDGYDSVFAQRIERKDNLLKRLQSKIFYKFFGWLIDYKLDASVANFGIYNRKVIEAILELGDKTRYFPVMALLVGFRQARCPVEHALRKEGKSSYSLLKLFSLAFNTITGFSTKPLRLMMNGGFICAILSFVLLMVYFMMYALGYIAVLGWATLILSIWFIGGITFFEIGMIGLYLSRVFEQTKQRPSFIVADRLNFDSQG